MARLAFDGERLRMAEPEDVVALARVGIIGLGAIGGGVARSLSAHGHVVLAHDVRQEAIESVGSIVQPTSDPRTLAESVDVVLVAVYDDAQVRDVLAGEASILQADQPPSDVVVFSTVTLRTIRWAHARCAERHVGLLDCGVTGGPQALEHDSIVSMVGGEDDAVARVKPLLDVFSSPMVHTGPPGTGMQTKLARNLLYFAGARVAWEAASLARAAGVPVEKLIEVVDASDPWTGGSTAILKRGFVPGADVHRDPAALARSERMRGFAEKDLGAAIALARELGLDLPAAGSALTRFDEVVGLGVDETA